jgi:hypothetical protein
MRSLAISALVLVVVNSQLGCGTPLDDETLSRTTEAVPAQSQRAAVQYIVENPAAYAGRAVTVAGEVVDIWSPRVFTIVGRQFAGNPALLVIAREAVPEFRDGTAGGANPRGWTIRIRGVVRLDTIAVIEREVGVEVAPAAQSLGQVKGPILLAGDILLSRD